MKQLLMLSGKGGTGKTTLTSAFIKLAQLSYYADCDVDAPNLHLLNQMDEQVKESQAFYGMDKAVIDLDKCIACGECQRHCRFDAIQVPHINPYACEGCGVCERICPVEAIQMKSFEAGQMTWMDQSVKFASAELKMGYGNSGLLVTEIKTKLKKIMAPIDSDERLAIIDGSPGIGCPVMASMTGVDLILLVAEPSLSGISDMKRVIETAEGFHLPLTVCVNKADINLKLTEAIKSYCQDMQIPFVGEVPYDPDVSKWVNGELVLGQLSEGLQIAMKAIWQKTYQAISTSQPRQSSVQISL